MVHNSSPPSTSLGDSSIRQLHISLGEFKQQIQRLNNQINISIFNTGLKEQKVEIFTDKALIFSKHSRAHLLQSLDQLDPKASRTLDLHLLQKYKVDLKYEFEQKFNIGVFTILKDYDPETEYAGTMIIFSEKIEFRS